MRMWEERGAGSRGKKERRVEREKKEREEERGQGIGNKLSLPVIWTVSGCKEEDEDIV